VHHVRGELEAAIAGYERAVALEDPYGYAWSNLGTIRYDQGRLGEAERAYRAALERRPDDAVLHRNLGDALKRLGRSPEDVRASYRRAVELLERDLSVNPAAADKLVVLAVCRAKLGDPGAAEALRQALELAPQDAEVAHLAAVTHALLGERESAIANVGRALELGFSSEVARTTDELEPLRGDPVFERLFTDEADPL
jgi:tetratricopeptide (TPR) repeat protein